MHIDSRELKYYLANYAVEQPKRVNQNKEN